MRNGYNDIFIRLIKWYANNGHKTNFLYKIIKIKIGTGNCFVHL